MQKIVCIPAFNEEKTINNVISSCSRFFDKIVVCDDGSTDDTFKKAEEAGATVIKHKNNKGKGAALKSLFKFVKTLDPEVVVTIDGDGQFLPEESEKLMKSILDGASDIVIGYRFDDKSEMPSYRKMGNKLLDKMTNLASDLPFRDTQSGFRAYSKKAIDTIQFTNDGFGADSEILIDASRKGLRIAEEKISVIYNTGGKTSTKNPVSHSTGVVSSLIELIAIRHPLKYLGLPGLVLLIIGIIYSVVVVAMFNDTRYFSIPSTLVALGSTILGLMLLLMSVVLFSINKATKKPM